MNERGYQHGFSLQHSEVFDVESRTQKAKAAMAVLGDRLGNKVERYSLLNVGSSSGVMDVTFARHFSRVVGIDIDEHAVGHAQRNYASDTLSFQVGDALNIPFEDKSFDVVVCSQIHEHVPDQKRLFDEIWRVLRNEGVCYFAATSRWIPLEPHYRMWFLSWLPRPMADAYLKVRGRGHHYYERMVGLRELKRLTSRFEVEDYTATMLEDPVRFSIDDMVKPGSTKQKVAYWIAKHLPSFCPGYIWLLCKHEAAS